MKHSISKSNSENFPISGTLGKLMLLVLFLLTTLSSAQVMKEFTPRYDETVKGDVTIIANNMLNDHPTDDFSGNEDNQNSNNRVYVDIDGDASTFNSSSANLANPEPGVSCLEFTQAYLYWAASDKEDGGDSNNDESWNYDDIKLMLPGSSSYSTLTADEVLFRGRDESGHFYNDPYICFKDITNEVSALTNPYGKYQAANVKAAWGGLDSHGGGNVGVAGGWQIVFVYQSTDLLRRNITLFDGYAHVHNGQTTDFFVDGFLAVPTGNVKADIVLGSIEGDRVLNQDNFQIKKPNGSWQKISTALRDENNFFSSRISIDGTDFLNRNPASTNTLGFDASVFDLPNPGNSLIANSQTSTTLRATSGQETYGLYLVGFAIEVYEPSLGALEFNTSPLNSTYNAGDIATLTLSIENSGNDNIRDLNISSILPLEIDPDATQSFPPGVTYTYNSSNRTANFVIADGYIDVGDDEFLIDFNVKVKEQCYFLETACSANFTIQATATFTGEINTATQTTNSSGTVNECGFGNHDPSIVDINQPAQVNWSSIANELDRTVSCDDVTALSDAQALEPTTEFCDFTLNKTAGVFVADPACESEGTYTNTWTFTDACGRVSETFTQVITIEDTLAPSFNEALPSDTVAAYDNIPSPAALTASDSCDTNPQVNFNETYIGDNGSTTYTIVRTWTASDCAGNTTEHTQNIFVTENGDPIGLAINDVSLNESAGTATFTVALTGTTSTDFTVNFASANGTALDPSDYDALSGTLSFNGTHGETQTIVVTINDDTIVESTENYTIGLSALSTTEIVINDASGLGTILDDDAATISINDIDVNENVGTVNLQIVLSGDVEKSFSVDFATSDGSALAGSDYNSVNGQVSFPANATNGNMQTIAITINDDNLIEATENFLVELSNISATGDITISDNQATVNILDNDAVAGTGIAFDNTDVTVDEAAGTATFTVRLTGNVPGGFTLDYASADGSAVAPGDYTSVSGTLAFTGNDNESYDIIVPIIDDALIEATEAYVVDLSNLSTALISINTPQANGGITDNDNDPSIGIQFDVNNIDVNEDVGTVSLNATLNADVQDEFNIEYNSIDGTAINPQDYTSVIGSLTFGGSNSNTQTIEIDIIDDIIIEDTENFQVAISNISTSLVNILANDTATVNIIDNDGDEGYPKDITLEACEIIPDAAEITSDSTCAITVVLEETIAGQDDGCPTDYTITRTWTITDCVDNIRVHTQIITIEDTIAPVFVEALPQDMIVACDEVPEAAILTALDNCDPNVAVTFEETVTNNSNCSMGYMITRTWMADDCAGNNVSHTQVITVPATGPITSSAYEEEVTIMCGEPIPEVPALEFMGGCGNFDVVFTEETQFSEESEDYMIVRTWNVTDACDNTATFEQLIFVMQPEKEFVSIDICVEDMTIDLTSYLPEDFDTNGVFTATSGNVILNGNFFDPIDHMVGDYAIAYTSLEGTCKYYVDFEIKVNADCVPCGRKDIIASKTVTPNGDGVNDYFEIKGVENCDFRFDVMLFNRWGAKVYEGVDYQNDWGGSSPGNSFGNSGMLPAGTYYYILKVTNRDFEPINGYIYLGTK